jgi:hypothetical protein
MAAAFVLFVHEVSDLAKVDQGPSSGIVSSFGV